jgi:hypothetical protein
MQESKEGIEKQEELLEIYLREKRMRRETF